MQDDEEIERLLKRIVNFTKHSETLAHELSVEACRNDQLFVENKRLRERISKLETALKPFAKYADEKGAVFHHDGMNMVLLDQDKLLQSCRAAKTALEGKETK